MKPMTNILIRLALFAAILSLGTTLAVIAEEKQGAVAVDISGAQLTALAADESNSLLVAGMVGGPQPLGLYKSLDGGLSWALLGNGPGVAVNALVFHPTNQEIIYAGTQGGPASTVDSLWRSENGGQTWRRMALALPLTPDGRVPAVKSLAVDPTEPETLYVGTDGFGLFRVQGRGGGYELIGGVALRNLIVHELALSSDGVLYARTQAGLLRVKGDDWAILDVPEQPLSLALASRPNVLYVGTPSQGIFKSVDGGDSWQQFNEGLGLATGAPIRITAVTVDDYNGEHVLAATAYGLGTRLARGALFESYDGGLTWAKLNETDGALTNLSLQSNVLLANGSRGFTTPLARQTPAQIAIWLPNVNSVLNLALSQSLVLALTIALASLLLVGRLEWVSLNRTAH